MQDEQADFAFQRQGLGRMYITLRVPRILRRMPGFAETIDYSQYQ